MEFHCTSGTTKIDGDNRELIVQKIVDVWRFLMPLCQESSGTGKTNEKRGFISHCQNFITCVILSLWSALNNTSLFLSWLLTSNTSYLLHVIFLANVLKAVASKQCPHALFHLQKEKLHSGQHLELSKQC